MSTTSEKTVLITGANVGIGKEIARQHYVPNSPTSIWRAGTETRR